MYTLAISKVRETKMKWMFNAKEEIQLIMLRKNLKSREEKELSQHIQYKKESMKSI